MGPLRADSDTICAIITPPGVGGVSIIRVSGPSAVETVKRMADFFPEVPLTHTVYYGFLRSIDQAVIDEVLLTYFKEGRSFTGEAVVEISCHGSPVICQQILKELVAAGARLADRGEFTFRAFMHGRLDLVQAEAVLSLINSQSSKAAEISLSQLKGGVSNEVTGLEDLSIWLLAHFEAQIDFSTEGLDVIDYSVAQKKIAECLSTLERLVGSYAKGRGLVEGFSVCFIGQPNVGKSSLLNNILQESRAIVTDVPGTTRDTVDGRITIDGAMVRIVDTAGLRDTEDLVEKIGVERSKSEASRADLVFLVLDAQKPTDLSFGLDVDLSDLRFCLLVNKVDLVFSRSGGKEALLNSLGRSLVDKFFMSESATADFLRERSLFVSAFDKGTRGEFTTFLRKQLKPGELGNMAVISQARHFEMLSKALEAMRRAEALIRNEESPELISIELREALFGLQETLGKRYDDEVLDRVFKEFCIGK